MGLTSRNVTLKKRQDQEPVSDQPCLARLFAIIRLLVKELPNVSVSIEGTSCRLAVDALNKEPRKQKIKIMSTSPKKRISSVRPSRNKSKNTTQSKKPTTPNIKLASSTARIAITNVYMEGDYTGVILVGPQKQPMNVILDTGSSALALDGSKYKPNFAGGDKSTNLAQTDSYGDGSTWTGAVINTNLTIGSGATSIALPGGNAAITYYTSGNMFGQSDGILGLAYAPLDDAFQMPGDTSKNQYSTEQVRAGQKQDLVPYLTQLEQLGVASSIISFYTHRSFVRVGQGNANDPLNNGWMIVGGGEEATDLYTGNFQLVTVVSDTWWCTVLKQVIVGNTAPIAARLQGPQGMPSNSIVDSGTNSLNLGPQLLKAILSKFTPSQAKILNTAITTNQPVPNSQLNLSQWPTISFVLQGDNGDVKLDVPASNYWQVDAGKAGYALPAITVGQPGLAILGLPVLNGYFTIFDGEADNGKGVIKFATPK